MRRNEQRKREIRQRQGNVPPFGPLSVEAACALGISGADCDAKAPGVNSGAKALELVAAGGALTLTGGGVVL